ncbi:MAG: site-specific DNA-methyltransferase [candidate division WOR-3 bacterium]|nr:site-specific DNA-methyltransferase [candidate division WOR-3 bacterium]
MAKTQAKHRRPKQKSAASKFPVAENNPFGIDTAPEVIERDSFVASDQPSTTLFTPVWQDSEHGVWLYRGNCLSIMDRIVERYPDGIFDMIFADPPYFLSNGGITCHAGRMVSVNKGDWDKSRGPEENHNFNREWLKRCQQLLRPNGTVWVTGTMHIIFSIGFAMQELGYKVLNDVIWWKTNPAPHLACRYLQHATETALWARKSEESRHVFHYAEMKRLNGGKQMQNVWRFPSVPRLEKALGGHPTQKPVALLRRMIECCSNPGDLILDPFMGSGSTGVACVETGRRFVGIDVDPTYCETAILRTEAALRSTRQGSVFGSTRLGSSQPTKTEGEPA